MSRLMRCLRAALAAATLLILSAFGAQGQSAPPPLTKPAWKFTPPDEWTFSEIKVGAKTVVAGGDSAIFAFDARSGRLRWSRNESGRTIVFGGDFVSYSTNSGAVVSRALVDGKLRWKQSGVCVASGSNRVMAASTAYLDGASLIVGCEDGRVSKIGTANGRVLARANALTARIGTIVPLGTNAYGIEGWSDGASIRNWIAIVDRVHLDPILAPRIESTILGALGETAIINDFCCNGRPDVYRPATILTVDLRIGRVSPEVDLRPEPERYPPEMRPLGQGAATFLNGGRLYLVVDHTLYDYGDPRSLRHPPKRITDDLAGLPIPVSSGALAISVSNPDGTITLKVVDIRGGSPKPNWSRRLAGLQIAMYEATQSPVALSVNRNGFTSIFRIRDGSEVRSTYPCRLVAAGNETLVMMCTTSTLIGKRYREDIATYFWPPPGRQH